MLLSHRTRSTRFSSIALVAIINVVTAHGVFGGEEVLVHSSDELRAALSSATSETTIRVAPGSYGHGYQISNVDRLTIEGQNPDSPPIFSGGQAGLICSNCDHLVLRNLEFRGQSGNGLNIDDGGRRDRPVNETLIENVKVFDIGPKGNHDGIKCSGVDHLAIRKCTISGWGGQAIDLVGCHDSVISQCHLIGKPGFEAVSGIQTKGGSSGIVIEECHFEQAGMRPMNIGGSTGLPFFRPVDAKYEAKDIVVRRCHIEGSSCAVAFASVDGAEFSNNVIEYPTKWVFRILQENVEPGFATCGNVVIKDNHITFRRSEVRDEVNIGGGTRPETFQFIGNQWHATDQPDRSQPQLPVKELKGRYGTNDSSGSTDVRNAAKSEAA